ncbi:hypothetical protein H0H93_009091 [Arthromyces matolae]|nr:hypothetical protein H0H93_009091 [Arthromyces matolae]
MVPRPKNRDVTSILASGAIEALQLAVPLSKAIPVVGSTVEGSLQAVLYILQVKDIDEVKVKKQQCQVLVDRAVAITAAITTELMKGSPAMLVQREINVASLQRTLRDIQTLLEDLASASLITRIFNRGSFGDKLTQFRQQLDTAIEIFHITNDMGTEHALTRLLTAIEEGEEKNDIVFVKSLLGPVTAASYFARSPNSGCFPGTRKTLLDQISAWFDNSQAPHIFWLSGLGGTGKTAVSHTICERINVNKQLGASFFFTRDEADRRRVDLIIPTIAFQLASVNPAYRRKLSDVLKDRPDASSRAQQYQLDELLLRPLKEVPSLPQYLIILDALDECDKEGGDLIHLLLQKLPNSGLNIKVLVTSRPERSIRDMFKVTGLEMKMHHMSVLHDRDQSSVKEDIARYLAHHMQRIQVNNNITPPWPEDSAFNDLVLRSGVFFIFAATIITFVADRLYTPQTQLQRLLTSGNTTSRSQVDSLYLQILQTFIEDRTDASELCARFRKVVGAIVLLQNPLSISALAHLLEHDEDDLERALGPLHSLLNVPSNYEQHIRIFHPSFRDFLLNEERCQDIRFIIPEGPTHAKLALYSLKIMLRYLKRDICGIGEEIVLNSDIPDLEDRLRECVPPALSYACQHWGDHLSQVVHDEGVGKQLVSHLSEFASTKLLYWIEVLSLEGRFSLCIRNLDAAMPWCKVASPTVYSLVYDAYRLALDYHNALNISALQVYHSALVFIPNCSLLRAYQHELPGVRMTSSRTEDWDASLLVLEGHTSSVNMVSLSRQGSRAASASDDGQVRIWDTFNGAQVLCFEGHEGPVKSIEYSPDSSYIASGGADTTILVWDSVSGSKISTLRGHKSTVNSVVFSNDGRSIASGSADCTVRIWDVLENKEEKEELASFSGHLDQVTCVAFLADGSRVLSGSMDSTIRLWDLKTNSIVTVIDSASTVLSLAISSTQQSIFLSGSSDGIITIRNSNNFKEIGRLSGSGEAAAVKSLAFSSEGSRVVSGFLDGTIRVWNTSSRSCTTEYRGHSGPVECAKFTPDGKHILSSSADRTIRLWEAGIEGVWGSKDHVMVVQIPNHVEHIVSGSTKGKVGLWNIDNGSLVYEVDVHQGTIYSLAFTSDDKLVASASADHTIAVLNVNDGSTVTVFKGHTDEVYTVQFSSADTLLVSASPDGQVILWNMSTKTRKRTLTHTVGFGVASFSPDDRLICCGTLDGEIHIHDVETGEQLANLNEYPSPILWVLYSPDGQWLAAWFEDEAVKVWKVDGVNYRTWPHCEWRLDRHKGTPSVNEDDSEKVKYGDFLPADELHYLQEDGWVTLPHTGKRICWIPPSRRQPWLRTLWESRKGFFAAGSQIGTLTVVDLRSTLP